MSNKTSSVCASMPSQNWKHIQFQEYCILLENEIQKLRNSDIINVMKITTAEILCC
jgi:hypothetical protein